MSLSVVRTQAERFTEFGQNLVACATSTTQHEPEHIVQFRRVGPLRYGFAKSTDDTIPVRRGNSRVGIKPSFELRQGSLDLILPQEHDPEIDESCRTCRSKSQRPLKIYPGIAPIAFVALRHPQ